MGAAPEVQTPQDLRYVHPNGIGRKNKRPRYFLVGFALAQQTQDLRGRATHDGAVISLGLRRQKRPKSLRSSHDSSGTP